MVESVQQDGVSPFAVQSDLPLWIPHYGWGGGENVPEEFRQVKPPNLKTSRVTQYTSPIPGLHAAPECPLHPRPGLTYD